MGFSEAVQWWEEWQLRVLVLASLFIQWFLFAFAPLRKRRIPAWFRSLIWLAYLGSDAVAIYALATLFSRRRQQQEPALSRRSDDDAGALQVLWAPILLVHLGGQEGITAYNIEDNELWRRHVLTAVSQITVAVYVFCKSWSGDRRILAPAILLFAVAAFKCLLKPWDLKRVSINSLVDSSASEDNGDIHSLHDYVRAAAQHFQAGHGGQPPSVSASNISKETAWKPYNLCVDLAPPYSDRLSCLKHLARNPDEAHHLLQRGLSETFVRLYTKDSVMDLRHPRKLLSFISRLRPADAGSLVSSVVAILFMIHKKKGYNRTDVGVTYALLLMTAVLELFIPFGMSLDTVYMTCSRRKGGRKGLWSDQVSQYNLIGYLARNRKHRGVRKLATLLVCKDFLDQLWSMAPCRSSRDITELVHGHVSAGWWQISGVADYRRFNDSRGQWTLAREGLLGGLGWSLRRPFDESVLLWHLATDLCFHHAGTPPPAPHDGGARRRSREMSDYMAYLLFVNPEMLMAGARRGVFRAAYGELEAMAPDQKPPPGEKEIAQDVIRRVMDTEGPGLVRDAWGIAQELIAACSRGDGGEDRMWRVIQGVWVEMLCFSAGRCRGYLHAKSLGKGGEYLSYVWLLLSYMGMETLAERMQRTELQEERDEGGIATRSPRWASPATTASDNNV